MIRNRTAGFSHYPDSLYKDMMDFYQNGQGTGCRPGVYKLTPVPGRSWIWWCPGCQKHSRWYGYGVLKKSQVQGIHMTWQAAFDEACAHVKEKPAPEYKPLGFTPLTMTKWTV